MNDSKSVLEFLDYTVDNITYKRNSEYNKDEVELKINFEHNIKKDVDKTDIYYVSLSANVFTDTDSDYKECPFELRIFITGCFRLIDCNLDDKMKESMINENTIAILFPYLRSLININPLILPTINVLSLLKNEKAQND